MYCILLFPYRVRHVFGACWIDYTDDMPWLRKTYSEYKKVLETGYKANWEMMSSVGQPSAKFLKPNLLGFAMNVFDKVVGYKYVDRYVNHFFVNEDGSPINKFFEKSTLTLFNPFSYANQSFHLSLTFNDEIRLRWALAWTTLQEKPVNGLMGIATNQINPSYSKFICHFWWIFA